METGVKLKKIIIVVGTRPNFIKITQFKKNAAKYNNIEIKIVHTGQHYDDKLSNIFFEQFKMFPDYYLNIEPSSPNSQIAKTMFELEMLFNEQQPDYIMVVGDVNSTLAGAITANRMGIKLIHVESGLRSMDLSMPEEVNRIITDKIADYCFVTEQSGCINLKNENKKKEQVFLVGNTMIDTMIAFEKEINASDILDKHNLQSNNFVLMTMHRPANVDEREGLEKIKLIIELLLKKKLNIVFPIHPRTHKCIESLGMLPVFNQPNIIITEPLDYFAFQKLIKECSFIVTDSGGIQEESTYRLKPCLTFRPNTERPITIEEGTNTLIDFNLTVLEKHIDLIQSGRYKKGSIPKYWDGNTTNRIIQTISNLNK
jgi:UDP-N-acetylglucosamine 2-epimerase (non-hydrolysing)